MKNRGRRRKKMGMTRQCKTGGNNGRRRDRDRDREEEEEEEEEKKRIRASLKLKLIRLEIVLLIIENLAVWFLLITRPHHFKFPCAPMISALIYGAFTTIYTVVRFLVLSWLPPDDMKRDLSALNHFLIDRIAVFLAIKYYWTGPLFGWYVIIVVISAMSTICSVTCIFKKHYLDRRRKRLIF
ncbi:hypothetical protein ACLB2K_054554 [Fragaria x ananassa]